MKNTYLIFIVQAYQREDQPNHLEDVCVLELIAENPDQAIDKAKKIIVKNHYRVSGVIEKYEI